MRFCPDEPLAAGGEALDTFSLKPALLWEIYLWRNVFQKFGASAKLLSNAYNVDISKSNLCVNKTKLASLDEDIVHAKFKRRKHRILGYLIQIQNRM